MRKMMWKEKYKVGAELIDTQHKRSSLPGSPISFKRFKHLVPGNIKTRTRQRNYGVMQHYVVVHFHDEEVFQEEISYPGLEKHREIHSRFKEGVFEYARRAERKAIAKN